MQDHHKKKVILVAGDRLAGKTTLSKAIPEFLGRPGERVHEMSAPVYREMEELGVKPRHFFELPDNKVKYRDKIIDFAESCKRIFGSEVWVRYVNSFGDPLVVSGLRFKEELVYLQEKYDTQLIYVTARRCMPEEHSTIIPEEADYVVTLDRAALALMKIKEWLDC